MPRIFRHPTWIALLIWARRVDLGRKLAIALTIAALASSAATIAVLNGASSITPDPMTVAVLLAVDLILVMALAIVVTRRLIQVWGEGRRGGAGSRLHFRLVMLFGLVALIPAALMAVFSVLYFSIALESWFNPRVKTAILESRAVASAYLKEHHALLASDIVGLAEQINSEGPKLAVSPDILVQILRTQSTQKGFSELVIFQGNGRLVARGGFSYSMQFSQIPLVAMERARRGEVVMLTGDSEDRVRAMVSLSAIPDGFLYIGRFVDPKVINHMLRTNEAAAEYEKAEGRRSGIEISFSAIFAVVTLLLFLSAIWVGLALANQLVRPIAALIEAADRVREGNLEAKVDETLAGRELGSLARAFNRMTSQLDGQRKELIETNQALDERRRFTETILSGVSAGVIGLDSQSRINLPNRPASDLLGCELESALGQPLADVVPEMADLLAQSQRRPERITQGEIRLERKGNARTLLVRVAVERLVDRIEGYVVTFDDITELLSAQRMAAWADVARRIAHEIKNPLTPIQLSAERLKRKYLKEIQTEPEIFSTCVETIVRQVGDIGRMVDEFSDFARMPAPVVRNENLAEVVGQAMFLQRQAHTAIKYEMKMPPGEETRCLFACDGRQINRALINLLKNAAESIEGREGDELEPGWIELQVSRNEPNGGLSIRIEDNGKGLPKEERHRLTEPYVTTRAKGTGLGLAIVKKIMEDHGGELRLEDRDGPGARTLLIFPRREVAATVTNERHGA
ncbi:MAG: PAS domain-containing sensor histidine kinase [Alphaproteobacteria bacterium]|nr:PAS domain-containing sensor histidine kinase [Alphaproteobacteria bacterium]